MLSSFWCRMHWIGCLALFKCISSVQAGGFSRKMGHLSEQAAFCHKRHTVFFYSSKGIKAKCACLAQALLDVI
jgi:hypothetical protein